jgi:hypothetical protein
MPALIIYLFICLWSTGNQIGALYLSQTYIPSSVYFYHVKGFMCWIHCGDNPHVHIAGNDNPAQKTMLIMNLFMLLKLMYILCNFSSNTVTETVLR